jgi:hypothetical protein
MDIAAALGRAAARLTLEKAASTALVRQIRKGLLSPEAIQGAASLLPAGKFRFVKQLGRGQFSLADQVVGNMGNQPGLLARKLPTRLTGQSIGNQYKPLQQTTDRINAMFRPQTGGVNPVAPYRTVGRKGAFQTMADDAVDLPAKLKGYLDDLTPGNVGPRGQVIDYVRDYDAPKWVREGDLSFKHPLIDAISARPGLPGSRFGSGWDRFGNIHPENLPKYQKFFNRSNNNIRRFWSLPVEQQRQFLQELRQTQTRRAAKFDRAVGGSGQVHPDQF